MLDQDTIDLKQFQAEEYRSSGKTVAHYFDLNRGITKTRFSEFVLLPQVPSLLTVDSKKPILDFDSDQLVNFSANTINMLKNGDKKVYPHPLIPFYIEKIPSFSNELSIFSLGKCARYIANERQYQPTFHIVGHGTPTGIGILDPESQISANDFARNITDIFETYNLSLLKSKPIHFVFHTCNSAYAKIDESMSKKEILAKVQAQSYIGQFYLAMRAKDFSNITVTGFRGYYSSMSTNKSSSAVVQDSFSSPVISIHAEHGEYTISEKGCSTKCQSDKYLTFPVPLLDKMDFTKKSFDLDTEFSRIQL